MRPLWLGGSITVDALTLIMKALDKLADEQTDAHLTTEIRDVANAAWAELSKADAGPAAKGHESKATCDLTSIGRRDTPAIAGG